MSKLIYFRVRSFKYTGIFYIAKVIETTYGSLLIKNKIIILGYQELVSNSYFHTNWSLLEVDFLCKSRNGEQKGKWVLRKKDGILANCVMCDKGVIAHLDKELQKSGVI